MLVAVAPGVLATDTSVKPKDLIRVASGGTYKLHRVGLKADPCEITQGREKERAKPIQHHKLLTSW